VTFSLPQFNLKKQIFTSYAFHVDGSIINRNPDGDNVYLGANDPQALRNEYSRIANILDTEYKQAATTSDDVINPCDNLHV
jgi:hypothetical protein